MPRITTNLTLFEALSIIIRRHPRREALTFGDRTLTFAALGARIERLARALVRLGVRPGDKVAIILPSCLEFPIAFFAPSAIGAVIVPVNPVQREKEIRHILEDCEASVVIAEPKVMGNDVQGILAAIRPSLPMLKHVLLRGADGEFKEDGVALLPADDGAALPGHPARPTDLAALVYTSGTTGVPKGVMHSHASMLSAVSQGERIFNNPLPIQMVHLLQLVRTYGRRFLRPGLGQLNLISMSPLHSLIGYGTVLYALLYGHHMIIAERFQPARILELIERYRANAFTVTPTMLAALLDCPDFPKRNVSSVLSVFCSAALCPPDLIRRAHAAFRCPIIAGFGATEVGGLTLMPDFADPLSDLSETVGKVFPGMQARIVDDRRCDLPHGQIGELALRLPSNMLGYYHAPELTQAATDGEGWYYTGDLATMDERGYIKIVGRKKEMIIRGGQKIFPAEIESHLLSDPAIENAAVVGVPDAVVGERVWAFILPHAGARITPLDVQSRCRAELAPYKTPDQVRIVESLPMTSSGKVQKFVLQETALKELAGSRANA